MTAYSQSHIKQLEDEAVFIIREVVAEFQNPVMLYSIGKDSSVMLRLAQKAFAPAPIPFPLMHIDTGYKPKEMIDFRDAYTKKIGARLIVESYDAARGQKIHPSTHGTDACCGFLKTRALLGGLKKHMFDAAFGGARRDEEKSRAKERVYSHRNIDGVWDSKNQRPELWQYYNPRLKDGETMRVFPISNWTEADVWTYIKMENIEIVPLYYARKRKAVRRNGLIIPVDTGMFVGEDEQVEEILCRYRSLGCSPCTGAIESTAVTIDDILKEVITAKRSERENRIIDLGSDSSMEQKKQQGYF